MTAPTFLFQPLLLPLLQCFGAFLLDDVRITRSARELKVHRLLEDVEAVQLLDAPSGRVMVVEDDECLALAAQALLGYDVEDVAIVAEYEAQSVFEIGDCGPLVQIADVHP